MAGIIEVKDQGKLRIYDADNSHYIDIVVPSSVTANRTITIPDASFTVPQADTDTVFNADAAQVFNESGADVDFRVESDDNANMIFLNGNTNGVGIGKDPTADTALDVNGIAAISGDLRVPTAIKSGSSSGTMTIMGGDSYPGGQIKMTGGIASSDPGTIKFFTDDGSDTDPAERMRIDSNGKVGIATANLTVSNNSSETSLELVNQSSTGNHRIVDFVDGAGSLCGNITINTGSNVVAYNTSSDYRLKENVDYTFDATTRLKQLKPARFNFIKDTDTTVDGFLAHEVSSIVPEAIFGTHNEVEVWRDGEELPDGVSIGDNKLDDNGNTIPKYQGIDQSKLVPLLVKTIQELEARITELENA